MIDNFKSKTIEEYSELKGKNLIVHYCCEVDGEIVGIAGGVIRNTFPSHYFKNSCAGYVMDVFVEECVKKNRIAKKLVESVEDWLKTQGVNVIKLDSSRFGKSLYEKSIEMSEKL